MDVLSTQNKLILEGQEIPCTFSWFKGYTGHEIRQMQLSDEAIGKVLEWKGEQNNWDVNLDCLAATYRASVGESTRFTPKMLLLGHEARKPYDVGLFG